MLLFECRVLHGSNVVPHHVEHKMRRFFVSTGMFGKTRTTGTSGFAGRSFALSKSRAIGALSTTGCRIGMERIVAGIPMCAC